MRKAWIVVKVLIGTIALACQNAPAKVPVVGVIVASEGPADFIGRPERDVLEALERDYDASPNKPLFRLRVTNSAGDPARATSLYRDFADDSSVLALIGPSTSGEAIAVATLSDSLKLPVLALAASKRIVLDSLTVRPWVFKFAQNDDLAAEALLSALSADGKRRIALLYSDDPFGRSGGDQFRIAAARQASVRLQYSAAFDPKLTSGDRAVTPIPRTTDAVVIWGTAGPAEIIHALKRRNLSYSIYLSHGSASTEFLTSLGAEAEGIVIIGSRVLLDEAVLNATLPADRVIIDYQRFWGNHFRGSASHFGGHARDAYEALARVFQSKTIHTRASVRRALDSLGALYGVTGTFRFGPNDHAGLDPSAFATFRVSQGKFIAKSGPTK